MDRSREARRATMAAANGLSRRRHRSSSLRDSPEEDGPELQETARLRDRGGSGKKDRDRDRDRERDRDRLSRSKRRRADRLLHSREDGGEESSEESVNDEEDDEDDDGAASVRMLPPNPPPLLSSAVAMSNHRKSFPPPAKVFRAASTWKAADEMIGVSVPRKARSASTKRSHECWASSATGVGAEQIHRQTSTSPVRPSLVSISVAAASPAPASPSSSNASLRKKMKPNGPKLRPPKSSSKSSSSAQDEIEIEIAEVLYGMLRQPQGPSKQEILATDSVKFDPREPNKSGDAKSRVSSPISNSTSAAPQSSAIPPQNSSSLVAPMSAVVAPKRKKPRAVKYDDENPSIFTVRNSPISTTTKAEIDQPAKVEASSSPNLEKKPGSVAENGGVPNDLANPQVVLVSSEAPPESTARPESHPVSDSKPLTGESEGKDVGSSKEEPQSPKKESAVVRVDDNREDVKANKANSTMSEVENHKEEKFQIDLMAPPPPPLRSSPERDGVIDFVAVDPKSMVTDAETEIKPVVKQDDKAVKIFKEEAVNLENEKAKSLAAEEAQSQTPVVARKERNIDLQVDLEKTDRDSGTASVSGNNKFHHHVQKQQPQHGSTERTAQTSPLPLPISVPGWPGGLPPMGYMAPLQGVVSMDGSTVTPAAIQPPQLLFTQPRPKRCATHCYIARNILYHQQLARMNPFWPAAAGSASLYGAKPCNLNVVPPAELHGNIPGRGVNSAQDKGQGLAMFTGHTGKDKGSQAAANVVDTSQRKQILLQPALPPGAPSNILHGPAFIFPLNQQQPAGAPSARSGSGKSPPAAGSAATSSASNSAAASASATAAAATAAPMSFNYPNMPGNETQYLAILQNNGYTFPIPAHVGAPPAYRGTHAQAMPFFNGSFYSSPMLHPSHIHHQQQQQQQQPPPQSQQSLQAHQNNASVSSGSSSSQKHLQNQQQRPHGNGVNGGAGNVQGFPALKNQSSQPLQQQQQQQQQQRQQQQNQHAPHQARQLESEMGAEDSPLSADSRVSRANMSIYGQNFAMPIHPPNFGFMNPAMMGGASGAGSASGNHTERKQQHGSKAVVEPPSSQAFPVSFASMNGATTTPGLDISSIAQNHAMFQNNYHIMAAAAAQVAQQKKNYRISEDGKTGGDSSNLEEERKAMPGKASATVGQSIAFSRPELADASVTTVKGNTVIDSSTRSLNLGSAPGRASGSVMPAAINTVNAPGSQQQLQRNQQQQIIQLKQQHQFAVAAATRSKTPVTSNGSVYSDHHLPSSSSMATKFSNLSSFPQNLVQTSSGSPAQSPQWKNSVRTATSQVPSPPLSTSNSSSLKNPLQQQGRTQQSHTQISFGGNAKSSTSQGQPPSSSNQSPSPPVMVGSPTTSSMSKSAGGSPRTTASTSTANKAGQASTLSSQQAKNAPSVPSRKSSPVGGRNVPSILGNHHITSTSDSATKPQLSQQQQQQQPPQQLPKHIQQAQLFFSNGYIHAQAPHSTGTTPGSPASAYYLPRNRREQQQQPQGSSGASSTGMLSLCPPLVNTSTSDPTKVAATAGSNMKGGGLPSQGILHVTQFGAAQSPGNPHQLLPAGFSYVRAVPTPVPVKPAEQKQPAGE